MKYLNKILRAKVVQGYEQGKTDEEIADSLKISRKIVVEIKLLEIACKLSQGFTELEIAERFHKPIEEIHRNKHNYILRRFSDSSSNNSISEIPPSSRIDSISQQIGGTKAYVLEKIIIQKLKKMENIEDITKSVSISLGETKKIIENCAIRKICEEGYTLEELHKMLHLNLAENPRVYNIYLEVKKENESGEKGVESRRQNEIINFYKENRKDKLEEITSSELNKYLINYIAIQRKKGKNIEEIAQELNRSHKTIRMIIAQFIISESSKGTPKQHISTYLWLTTAQMKKNVYNYLTVELKANTMQHIAWLNSSTFDQIQLMYIEGALEMKKSIHKMRPNKDSSKKLAFLKRHNKEEMKKIRVEFIQGLENKISHEELIEQLKISRPNAYRILNLEIARSIYQGFSVLQIAERLHKSSISIMDKKHAFIQNSFKRHSDIPLIAENIGCSEDYVMEKLVVHKLKIKKNIKNISESLNISVEKTKTIIEDYAIKKIHQGYTREELNIILPVSLDGYPRILETFKKVEKNNKLEGESKNTNTLLLKTQPERVLEQLSFEELVKKLRKGIKIGDIATELDWTSEMVRYRMAEFIIQHSIKGMSKEEIGNQLCLTQTDIKVLPYQYIRDYIALYHQIQRIAERNGCTLAQIYKIYVEGGVAKGVSINEIACTLKINEEAVQEIVNKIQNESQPELNSPEPPIIEKAISEVKKNLIQEGTIQPPKPISIAESTNQFHQTDPEPNSLDLLSKSIISEYKKKKNIKMISAKYNVPLEVVQNIISEYIVNKGKKGRRINEVAAELYFSTIHTGDGQVLFIHQSGKVFEVKKNLIQEGTIQPPKPISMAESTNQFHQIYTKSNRIDPLREIIVSEYKENQNIGVISYQYNLSPEEVQEIICDYIRNEEKKGRTVNEIATEFSFYSVPNSDGKLRFIHKDEVLSLVKNNPLYQSTSHQPLQPISMDELTKRFHQIELRSNSSDQVKGKYEKSQEMKSEGERKRRNSESDPSAMGLSLKKARVDSPILSQPKSFSSTTTRAVEKVQNVIEQKRQQHLNNPRVQASLRSFVNERS
ncbi:hypothetical protein ACJZQ5_000442 [Enterococcus hirae]|uniref:Bacterial regulatory proteins, luxR family n=15 Tax=Enterococcus hirae TaxID=1354 RepID=A0A7Z9DKA9_ENTHR|nr:hypothetical protein [Enterococcus hirae]EOH70874.1 hypothetical protein UAE_01484 [Enterococcus hirae ATCC 9790]EOU07419.1 hypothetical protein I584_00741 [Enterococcus hirae ATCC 9790]OJG53395.1 hypothetical protein RV05_GL000962 [Enterococcus hirae]QQY22813.1 hypothetical protein I6I80_04730 [Enterococcus hirae]VTQ65024.1 Bacterial regulatory proteins, luxR family [Enterococcus hirae]